MVLPPKFKKVQVYQAKHCPFFSELKSRRCNNLFSNLMGCFTCPPHPNHSPKFHLFDKSLNLTGLIFHPLLHMCFSRASRVLATSFLSGLILEIINIVIILQNVEIIKDFSDYVVAENHVYNIALEKQSEYVLWSFPFLSSLMIQIEKNIFTRSIVTHQVPEVMFLLQ